MTALRPAGARRARALWGASHPGPTLVVTALACALGIAAGADAPRIAVLTAAVFAGQLSVGISNDAWDAERDRAVSRVDKPVARGDVSVQLAWLAAGAALAVALALSSLLGWRMLAAHALALGSAWAYNAGLKSTPFSIVPFVLSFGLAPSLATLSTADPSFAAGWAWLAGGAIGAAVHLTNVLPDLADDARTNVHGLPHRIGRRMSTVLAAGAVVFGATMVLLGSAGWDAARIAPLSWIFFGAVVAVSLITVVRAATAPPGRELFRLVMLAALLLAAQLVATGSALAG